MFRKHMSIVLHNGIYKKPYSLKVPTKAKHDAIKCFKEWFKYNDFVIMALPHPSPIVIEFQYQVEFLIKF